MLTSSPALCRCSARSGAAAPARGVGRAVVARAAGWKQSGEDDAQSALLAPRLGALAAATVLSMLAAAGPASADLNRLEAAAGGEFNVGTALQYGEATIDKKSFAGQDLRRSNFTAASCRSCNFAKTKLNGAYLIKAVMPSTDFRGADLSDSLADRAVFVDANFEDAVLQRVVFTRSDLGGANVHNADFSSSLLDRTQQQALCRYADGKNPTTGVETRASLGCGSRRRRLESTPSNPEGPAVRAEDKDAFVSSMPVYRK